MPLVDDLQFVQQHLRVDRPHQVLVEARCQRAATVAVSRSSSTTRTLKVSPPVLSTRKALK
jgi:hypothetical protein